MAWVTSLVARVAALELQDAGTAAETIQIGDQTYTLRASVGTTANEVKVGADATASAANLVAAVNLGDTAGTNYGSNTVENIYADAVDAGDGVVTLNFKPGLGVMGNALTLTASGDVTVTTQSVAGSGNPVTFWTQVKALTQCNAEILDALDEYLGTE